MTNVDALKAVYVALGGDADDFTATTNDAAIYAIAQVIAATGGSLPAVTAADNGKVLTVVEGEWAAAALPGG